MYIYIQIIEHIDTQITEKLWQDYKQSIKDVYGHTDNNNKKKYIWHLWMQMIKEIISTHR